MPGYFFAFHTRNHAPTRIITPGLHTWRRYWSHWVSTRPSQLSFSEKAVSNRRFSFKIILWVIKAIENCKLTDWFLITCTSNAQITNIEQRVGLYSWHTMWLNLPVSDWKYIWTLFVSFLVRAERHLALFTFKLLCIGRLEPYSGWFAFCIPDSCEMVHTAPLSQSLQREGEYWINEFPLLMQVNNEGRL